MKTRIDADVGTGKNMSEVGIKPCSRLTHDMSIPNGVVATPTGRSHLMLQPTPLDVFISSPMDTNTVSSFLSSLSSLAYRPCCEGNFYKQFTIHLGAVILQDKVCVYQIGYNT